MAELEKNRAGLQKPVSSVFKGVPMPQTNNGSQPSNPPASDHASANPNKPSTNNKVSPSSLVTRLSQSEESIDTPEPAPKVAAAPKPPVPNKPKPQVPRVEKPEPAQESPEAAVEAQQVFNEQVVEASGPSFVQTIKDKLFPAESSPDAKKQKAMIVLIPILAIIMIFTFRQVLSKSPNKTKGAANSDTAAAAVTDPHEINWKIPEPLPAVMRDPLKFADQQTSQNIGPNGTADNPNNPGTTGTLNIRDILYSKDKPSAVVGDHIVYIGDKVNGATITKINRDSVEFEKDGKTWVQTTRD